MKVDSKKELAYLKKRLNQKSLCVDEAVLLYALLVLQRNGYDLSPFVINKVAAILQYNSVTYKLFNFKFKLTKDGVYSDEVLPFLQKIPEKYFYISKPKTISFIKQKSKVYEPYGVIGKKYNAIKNFFKEIEDEQIKKIPHFLEWVFETLIHNVLELDAAAYTLWYIYHNKKDNLVQIHKKLTKFYQKHPHIVGHALSTLPFNICYLGSER
jgi:hypothetical protein